jgi:hypothetical protein
MAMHRFGSLKKEEIADRPLLAQCEATGIAQSQDENP